MSQKTCTEYTIKYWIVENWGNLQTKYICQGERNMKMSNMRNLCLILLGNTVYALAIVMFYPAEYIITGGTTGLGIAVNHYFGFTDPYICTDLQHTDVSSGGPQCLV